jgi:hypothetical protein
MEVNLEGVVLKEQGVTFAVVIVKKHIVDDPGQASEAIRNFSTFFPRLPIVLMGQDSRGVATYYGRKDIAKFLAGTPLRAIPWKKYTFTLN